MNINYGMNIITAARRQKKMTAQVFGIWLSQQLGSEPISKQYINSWELGERAPRAEVRKICAPEAADFLLETYSLGQSTTKIRKVLIDLIE